MPPRCEGGGGGWVGGEDSGDVSWGELTGARRLYSCPPPVAACLLLADDRAVVAQTTTTTTDCVLPPAPPPGT